MISTLYEETLIMNKEKTTQHKNGQRIWVRKVTENMSNNNVSQTFGNGSSSLLTKEMKLK